MYITAPRWFAKNFDLAANARPMAAMARGAVELADIADGTSSARQNEPTLRQAFPETWLWTDHILTG
jgi:hypothetical protein